MSDVMQGAVLTRDGLPTALTQLHRQSVTAMSWDSISERHIPERGGCVGTWNPDPGNPLAEVLVVRDEDFADAMAWLGAFLAPLAPITQWCRILTVSQAEQIARRRSPVTLGRMLGPWVGSVMAECSLQAGGSANLKELPGLAAVSSATFAAGRATAVWSPELEKQEIAKRHDDLSLSFRDAPRPIGGAAMLPLWAALSGSSRSADKAINLLTSVLVSATQEAERLDTAELVSGLAQETSRLFDLPELAHCAQGPQGERLRALDHLGQRLVSAPNSPANDGFLGLGASFLDPGAAVLPDLLRRYEQRLPLAPLWLGAFAGALSPIRVLTDQQGLGRLIAKALLAPDDLHNRPNCDIAYEELSRWLPRGKPGQMPDVRGMVARALSVEIWPGVTCAFFRGRIEQPQSSQIPRTRSEPPRGTDLERSGAPIVVFKS